MRIIFTRFLLVLQYSSVAQQPVTTMKDAAASATVKLNIGQDVSARTGVIGVAGQLLYSTQQTLYRASAYFLTMTEEKSTFSFIHLHPYAEKN